MKFNVRVEVRLKPGYSDPEGETTKQSLQELEFPIESVSVAKVYKITLNAKNQKEARSMIDSMCKRLLANPVKDDYSSEIEET